MSLRTFTITPLPPDTPTLPPLNDNIRGSGTKNMIFSNGPKIIFEWSNLLYYVWIWYPVFFCKKIDQNPPIGCAKLSFGISGQKSFTIFPGFIVVCLLCWLKYGILNIWASILSYQDWIINKITLDYVKALFVIILTHLLRASKLRLGQVVGKNAGFCLVF